MGRAAEVQIGWRIYMIDGDIMDSGSQVWQRLQDAQWQWRSSWLPYIALVLLDVHLAFLKYIRPIIKIKIYIARVSESV